MDIVAESLSANLLKARNVTVRGQDVLEWFQSKLSVAVSFAGVFDDLSAAPKSNGAIAIVGSKDYVYNEALSGWQELGDEGQIGVLSQAVAALSNDISSCVTSSDVDSALSSKQDKISVDGILSCDGDGNVAAVPPGSYALSSDLRYRIVRAPFDQQAGAYALADRAVNQVTLSAQTVSAAMSFPPREAGYARDFMLRLVIEGAEVPQDMRFFERDGSDVEFDADDQAWADIGQGVNLLLFTDTAEPEAAQEGE